MNAKDLHGMLLGAANTMKLHNYQYKTPEGVTSVGIGDTNTDININQERYRFDDYVTQYEQENDIKLANAHDSMKYEFFDDIYAQGYTISFVKENKEILGCFPFNTYLGFHECIPCSLSTAFQFSSLLHIK